MISEDQVENDEVDAASAMSYNEYLLLLETGYSEDDLNVIDPNKEGESATEDHQIAMTKKVVEFVAPDGNTDEIGKLDTDALQQTIDLGVQSGLIKKAISLDKSVDSSYWEKAVK